MDRNAQKLGDRLHGKCGSAAGETGAFAAWVGCVDAAITKAGNVHPHIARNGQHARRFTDGINGE